MKGAPMNKLIKFIILQGSIVLKPAQNFFDTLQPEDTPKSRNIIFRGLFDEIKDRKKLEVSQRISEYIIMFHQCLHDDLLHFQLAKKTEVEIIKASEHQFDTIKEDSYPYINLFVNLTSQRLLLELNPNIIIEDSLLNTVQKLFSNILKYKNYSLYFTIIDDVKEFWDITKDGNIKEIEFDLIAPNGGFWGNNNQAKDFAKDTKDKLNADETKIVFKNKNGNMNVSMDFLDSLVTYSSKAGSWKLKIRKDGKQRIIKSVDFSKKVEIESTILDAIVEHSKNPSESISTIITDLINKSN